MNQQLPSQVKQIINFQQKPKRLYTLLNNHIPNHQLIVIRQIIKRFERHTNENILSDYQRYSSSSQNQNQRQQLVSSQMYSYIFQLIDNWNIQKFTLFTNNGQISTLLSIDHIKFNYLKYLVLEDNQINNIQSLAFINAPQLIELTLSGNYISTLKSFGKCHYKQLESLQITRNPINFQQMNNLSRCNLNYDHDHFEMIEISFIKLTNILNTFLSKFPTSTLSDIYIKDKQDIQNGYRRNRWSGFKRSKLNYLRVGRILKKLRCKLTILKQKQEEQQQNIRFEQQQQFGSNNESQDQNDIDDNNNMDDNNMDDNNNNESNEVNEQNSSNEARQYIFNGNINYKLSFQSQKSVKDKLQVFNQQQDQQYHIQMVNYQQYQQQNLIPKQLSSLLNQDNQQLNQQNQQYHKENQQQHQQNQQYHKENQQQHQENHFQQQQQIQHQQQRQENHFKKQQQIQHQQLKQT